MKSGARLIAVVLAILAGQCGAKQNPNFSGHVTMKTQKRLFARQTLTLGQHLDGDQSFRQTR